MHCVGLYHGLSCGVHVTCLPECLSCKPCSAHVLEALKMASCPLLTLWEASIFPNSLNVNFVIEPIILRSSYHYMYNFSCYFCC